MGLLTDMRRSITRLWGRTEQLVGEAYGNEALEYEGEADEARVDAEEAADGQPTRPHSHRHPHDDDDDDNNEDDGTAGVPAR